MKILTVTFLLTIPSYFIIIQGIHDNMKFNNNGYRMMDQTVNYLGVSGPLKFNTEEYFLKWSANPIKGYYKQEYLRSKDDYPDFNRMLMLEYSDVISAKEAIAVKVKELEDRNKTDPVLHYEINKSPDGKQYMIDFMLSSGNIYEWNVYKYIPFVKNGKEAGNVLFGFCIRSSEKGELTGSKFFDYMKTNRIELLNKMIETNVPNIKIK